MYYIWNREDENTEYYIGKTKSFKEAMDVIKEKLFKVGWQYYIIKFDNNVIWYRVKTKNEYIMCCFNIEEIE